MEGQRWLEETLSRAGDAPAERRGTGFGQACVLATMHGDYDRAVTLGQEGLRLRRAIGDERGIVRNLLALALAAARQLDYPAARALLEESLTRSRALGYTRATFQSLLNLGEVALNQGDLDQAVAMTEESLELIRGEGDIQFLINGLDNLARAFLARGDRERAAALWTEGLELSWQRGDRRGLAYYLEGFAALAAAEGRVEQAGRLAGAADALRQEIQSPLSPPEGAILERFLASVRNSANRASWDQAWKEGRSMLLEEAVEDALSPTARRPSPTE